MNDRCDYFKYNTQVCHVNSRSSYKVKSPTPYLPINNCWGDCSQSGEESDFENSVLSSSPIVLVGGSYKLRRSAFDSQYSNHPRSFDTSVSLMTSTPTIKDPTAKAQMYQLDVAKTNTTPIVGGMTMSTTAQSGPGMRHGLFTVV